MAAIIMTGQSKLGSRRKLGTEGNAVNGAKFITQAGRVSKARLEIELDFLA